MILELRGLGLLKSTERCFMISAGAISILSAGRKNIFAKLIYKKRASYIKQKDIDVKSACIKILMQLIHRRCKD